MRLVTKVDPGRFRRPWRIVAGNRAALRVMAVALRYPGRLSEPLNVEVRRKEGASKNEWNQANDTRTYSAAGPVEDSCTEFGVWGWRMT